MLTQGSEKARPRIHDVIIEAALFAAHLPVLVVPRGGIVEAWPQRIAIGWDDGPEALAAIRASLPLRRKA